MDAKSRCKWFGHALQEAGEQRDTEGYLVYMFFQCKRCGGVFRVSSKKIAVLWHQTVDKFIRSGRV